MKKSIILILSVFALSACNSWLQERSPMTNTASDYFTGYQTAEEVVIAAYVPAMWEYQSTYFSEFFFGDVMSDDALKGGQNTSDMSDVFYLENFKATDNLSILLDYYRAQYQGITRANLAIEQIETLETDEEDLTPELKNNLLGEAHFLRAFYYFRLVRLFGAVPIVTSPIYSSDKWKVPRAESAQKVYDEVINPDLKFAAANLPKKSEYTADNMGRATQGAAQAMLLKVYLYQKNYSEAASWGQKFMTDQAGEYSLCPNYADNFTLAGENGPESIFEIQYMLDPTSDYGEGDGFTRGSFTTILTRARSGLSGTVTGWGFNRPTHDLYNEYETGDPRRDATIISPLAGEIKNPAEDIYLGDELIGVKRTLYDPATRSYEKLDHDSRSPINLIVIRLADVYLMYAEALKGNGDEPTAWDYIDDVRARAGLAPADHSQGFDKALRHERRVELAMEGHRWFDLCRWGIAKETMNAYRAGESDEVKAVMSEFRDGFELLPIPYEEVRLGGLEQNPAYK